jgi:hypothetical protein
MDREKKQTIEEKALEYLLENTQRESTQEEKIQTPLNDRSKHRHIDRLVRDGKVYSFKGEFLLFANEMVVSYDLTLPQTRQAYDELIQLKFSTFGSLPIGLALKKTKVEDNVGYCFMTPVTFAPKQPEA